MDSKRNCGQRSFQVSFVAKTTTVSTDRQPTPDSRGLDDGRAAGVGTGIDGKSSAAGSEPSDVRSSDACSGMDGGQLLSTTQFLTEAFHQGKIMASYTFFRAPLSTSFPERWARRPPRLADPTPRPGWQCRQWRTSLLPKQSKSPRLSSNIVVLHLMRPIPLLLHVCTCLVLQADRREARQDLRSFLCHSPRQTEAQETPAAAAAVHGRRGLGPQKEEARGAETWQRLWSRFGRGPTQLRPPRDLRLQHAKIRVPLRASSLTAEATTTAAVPMSSAAPRLPGSQGTPLVYQRKGRRRGGVRAMRLGETQGQGRGWMALLTWQASRH